MSIMYLYHSLKEKVAASEAWKSLTFLFVVVLFFSQKSQSNVDCFVAEPVSMKLEMSLFTVGPLAVTVIY